MPMLPMYKPKCRGILIAYHIILFVNYSFTGQLYSSHSTACVCVFNALWVLRMHNNSIIFYIYFIACINHCLAYSLRCHSFAIILVWESLQSPKICAYCCGAKCCLDTTTVHTAATGISHYLVICNCKNVKGELKKEWNILVKFQIGSMPHNSKRNTCGTSDSKNYGRLITRKPKLTRKMWSWIGVQNPGVKPILLGAVVPFKQQSRLISVYRESTALIIHLLRSNNRKFLPIDNNAKWLVWTSMGKEGVLGIIQFF